MDSNTIERSQSTYEQTRKINRAALKALLIIVFMGWLLIWIMVPTMTYKFKWTSKLKAKANSTYFGGQGTNLLIFSFPVMFIAFISCVYLHLENTNDSQRTGGSHVRLAILRSPVFVKAPLGIVTGMELMFSTMFIVLLIWSIAHYLHVSFQDPYMNKEGAQRYMYGMHLIRDEVCKALACILSALLMESKTVQRSHAKHDQKKISRAALRALLIIVFMGWLMIWVMVPTKTYKSSWKPQLTAKANSTFFGEQGTNLLLFTFPVMFIAVVSCLYLHLGNKRDSQSTSGNHPLLAILKRPIFVKAPLGIVTATELMFSAMFIALLIWSMANYLYVSYQHLHMHKEGEQIWKAKFRSVSLRLGYVGNICWAFLFFPVTRGSSILLVAGLTSESSIKYHIWLGHLSMILFTTHSIGFIIYWAMTDQMSLMLEWSKDWVSNVAGEIAFVLALAMWGTSFPFVRRKMFELFFYTHHLYILYLFFYILHVGIPYFCMILPGVFLFLIDRYLRFLQSSQKVQLVSAQILPCETVELNFSKSPGLAYSPTSIVFINVPSISKLQWHPFTVTSNCELESDNISIVIKSEGSWSQKLYQTLSSPSLVDQLDVSVEGPYAPTSLPFLRHDSLVIISGGSGITSMISILREIMHKSTTRSCSVKQVHLIYASKNYINLSMLDLLLPVNGLPSDISSIQLKIEAYITREKEQPVEDTKKCVRTIWFKPSKNHMPLTPILGTNSWLWLGAIISVSFFMFLLLLGILTQYYIYPIDHNTNKIYHFSGRALWDMFFACISIIILSSAAFYWNKKKNTSRIQIQDRDVPRPSASPSTWFQNSAPEIEALPHQSLVQATELHFGARPNLKDILVNCKGSDVGVVVSGPRKMRHEVANICSSGLVNNLHFEAISYNW